MAIRPGPNGYDGMQATNPKDTRIDPKQAVQEAKKHNKNMDIPESKVTEQAIEWRDSTKKGMNVDLFKYNFDSGARANRFNVNFMCPALNINLQGLRCTNATLPGRQIETADFSTYGPTEKRPFNVSQDGQEVSFTFVCDSTFADRFILEAWQGAIYSGHTITGFDGDDDNYANMELEDVANVPGNSVHPMFNYLYGHSGLSAHGGAFGDEGYAGIVEIQQFTRSDKLSLTYELIDAFPISYAPQQLDSSAGDALMQFECTFAFRTFSTKYSQPANSTALNRGSRWIDAMLDIKNLRKGGNSSTDTLQRFNDRLKSFSGLFG